MTTPKKKTIPRLRRISFVLMPEHVETLTMLAGDNKEIHNYAQKIVVKNLDAAKLLLVAPPEEILAKPDTGEEDGPA